MEREVVSTKNKTVSSSDRTASCSSEASSKKKSLKIKHRSHSEAATYEYPATKHDILDDEQIDEIDLDIKEFMKKYWSSIRTFTKKNKVSNIFNLYYNKDLKEMIEKITEAIIKQ